MRMQPERIPWSAPRSWVPVTDGKMVPDTCRQGLSSTSDRQEKQQGASVTRKGPLGVRMGWRWVPKTNFNISLRIPL